MHLDDSVELIAALRGLMGGHAEVDESVKGINMRVEQTLKCCPLVELRSRFYRVIIKCMNMC